MPRYVKSLCVLLRRSNAGCENSDEFFGFNQERTESLCGNEFNSRDETKPAPDLLKLFETNAELVNEIFARFRSLNFTMICKWRCSASQQLSRNVIRGSRVWQRIDELREPHRKLEQTIFKVEF